MSGKGTPSKALDDDLVMSLVELAMAQPPKERDTYIASACGRDTELSGEVRKYVEWEELMGGFLLDPLFPPSGLEHRFEPGDLLASRFRIVRALDEGGMGIVYEAADEKLERRVAIKCAKAGFRKRLPPEVRHASEISHPNVCKIHEIHTASTPHGEVDFITMELLEGETLAARLHRGRLPEPEARGIARQLCAGLAEAHRHRVVHGDLKTNNVILAQGPDGAERAVITDFGLARGPAANATRDRAQSLGAGGAPDYMAPELWKGEKATPASDVYALGVMMCELAVRRRPFDPGIPLERRLTARPPAIHPKWDRVLARCLEPVPAKRFQDAGEVVRALDRVSPVRWWLAAGAAIAVAAVVGGVTYERAIAPPETVRLGILPFNVVNSDPEAIALSQGLLIDTGNRLNRLKTGRTRRITVIPLGDALQNKVDQPAKARTLLGATYVLNGEFRKEGERISVSAHLIDATSLTHAEDRQYTYSPNELPNMPVALAGMVTGTLRLPPLDLSPTVNAAAYPYYSEGVALARSNPGVDRALSLLQRAVDLDPNSPLTHAKLAEAQWLKYTTSNSPEWQAKALASLKDAEQRNPDVADVRLVSGMIQDAFGHYVQAETDMRRVIELDPNNGDAWRQLGKVYEDRGQSNLALTAYLKAIDLQPGYFKNYRQLGYFHYRRGEYEEAVRQRKRVVELLPDLADAHYELGAAYINLARYSDAEYELNLALGIQETANTFLGLAGLRVYQGQDREAIPYIQRAIAIGPATSLYYMDLGTAFRRSGSRRQADDAYRKGLDLAESALSQNPSDGYERSCLAYLCARLGDGRRAASEIAQALRMSGDAINVRWIAVQTYQALGQRDRALALLQDAPASILDRINRFPDLADLRSDPRFLQLLASHHVQ
jgi:serine/threonine-protein kinase